MSHKYLSTLWNDWNCQIIILLYNTPDIHIFHNKIMLVEIYFKIALNKLGKTWVDIWGVPYKNLRQRRNYGGYKRWAQQYINSTSTVHQQCVANRLVKICGQYKNTEQVLLNSLAPGGFENIFQNVFFKLISWIDTLSNSCETALRSMPQNPSDDKSTLVQVMAWCRQAASHYLSQCCPRSLSPYGVTRPQWVNHVKTDIAHAST